MLTVFKDIKDNLKLSTRENYKNKPTDLKKKGRNTIKETQSQKRHIKIYLRG